MSDWQPARLRIAHLNRDYEPEYIVPDDLIAECLNRVVHIQLGVPDADTLHQYRMDGCDGNVFYRIDPNDLPDKCGGWACEHEVLTD
jgi:hypothetical protein